MLILSSKNQALCWYLNTYVIINCVKTLYYMYLNKSLEKGLIIKEHIVPRTHIKINFCI